MRILTAEQLPLKCQTFYVPNLMPKLLVSIVHCTLENELNPTN